MSAIPERFTVVLKPQLTDAEGHPDHGGALRSATVERTGRVGASGFPCYAGDGVQVDVDPATRTVEAATVDGSELPYGWVAEVATYEEETDEEERDEDEADEAGTEET